MSKGSVRELRALRDAALREARTAALDSPDPDLRARIERIEAYDRLLAAAPRQRWRELAWAVAVALVCVSLLGAALSIRVPSARIVLEVTAGTATVALAEPWQFNDSAAVQTRLLSLREVEDLELPAAAGIPQASMESAWVDVDGGRVTLTELSFGTGSAVTLEVGPERDVNLFARGGSLQGAVILTGAQRLAAGQGISDVGTSSQTNFQIPETISFRSGGEGAVPTQLRFVLERPVELYDMRVQRLSFTRDIPSEPGGIEFVSTIEGGQLTLSDIGRTVPLRKYELLSLREVDGRVPRLAIDDRIALVFEGTAAEVRLGPRGFQQDLTPTIAEYLYHNQRVVFLWSALAFTWGVLWSARRMLAV
jgi:hypothetical protein